MPAGPAARASGAMADAPTQLRSPAAAWGAAATGLIERGVPGGPVAEPEDLRHDLRRSRRG